MVVSRGPVEGRGGGFRLLYVLGPGVGDDVSDLVRLLVTVGRFSMLVARSCSGCLRSTYGSWLRFGLVLGCLLHAAGGIFAPSLASVSSCGPSGYNDS